MKQKITEEEKMKTYSAISHCKDMYISTFRSIYKSSWSTTWWTFQFFNKKLILIIDQKEAIMHLFWFCPVAPSFF